MFQDCQTATSIADQTQATIDTVASGGEDEGEEEEVQVVYEKKKVTIFHSLFVL